METYQQQQMNREKGVEKGIEEGGAKLRQENKEDFPTSPPPSQTSNSSSPAHEFSFTISLHQSNSYTNKFSTENSKATAPPNNSLAVDLSPADEIFFHGHLLPLHLLSHLPQSPRSSTNSMDSFTLPIRELLEDESPKQRVSCSTSNRSNITIDNNDNNNKEQDCNNRRTKGEGKSNFAFSLFGLKTGLKGSKDRDKEDKEKHKKKLRFDVIHALKKYLKMVQPIVLFKGRREKFRLHGKSSYSYSGNVTPRNNKQEFRGWGGQYSAPASMRTSPTNSGLLLATTALPPASDSTMEELQAAIQAAIAHCKNSIAKEEKLKC